MRDILEHFNGVDFDTVEGFVNVGHAPVMGTPATTATTAITATTVTFARGAGPVVDTFSA